MVVCRRDLVGIFCTQILVALGVLVCVLYSASSQPFAPGSGFAPLGDHLLPSRLDLCVCPRYGTLVVSYCVATILSKRHECLTFPVLSCRDVAVGFARACCMFTLALTVDFRTMLLVHRSHSYRMLSKCVWVPINKGALQLDSSLEFPPYTVFFAGNLRTTDGDGPYNISLLATQINEVKGR